MIEKDNFFVAIFLAGLVSALAATAYYYREDIRTLKISKDKTGRFFSSESRMNVKPVLFANIGTKHLRLKLNIPCKDKEQKDDLLRKMPRIKHELLMSMSSKEVELSIEQKNFNAIRKHLLHVFNSHVTEPLEKLYFEGFFYN